VRPAAISAWRGRVHIETIESRHLLGFGNKFDIRDGARQEPLAVVKKPFAANWLVYGPTGELAAVVTKERSGLRTAEFVARIGERAVGAPQYSGARRHAVTGYVTRSTVPHRASGGHGASRPFPVEISIKARYARHCSPSEPTDRRLLKCQVRRQFRKFGPSCESLVRITSGVPNLVSCPAEAAWARFWAKALWWIWGTMQLN
jgi:hypothetical protein